MDFLSYRKLLTEANRDTRFIRKNRIPVRDVTVKSVNGIPINENTQPMGITPKFSQNPFNIIHFGFFDNADDEPTRIIALKIKSKRQALSSQELKYLQDYQDSLRRQNDKDSRYVSNEIYRTGKQIVGLPRY